MNLVQQGSLSGAVSDSEGNAVSGAHIELVSSSDSSVQRSAQSASDGTYSFSNLDAGTYYLTVFLDGYAPLVNQTIVVSGSTTFNATLSPSTTTVSGKVESTGGSPVAHATVVIVDANGQPVAIETTGNDGTFTTTSALGTNLFIVAGKSGYGTSAPVQITIDPGAITNVGAITIQPASIADPGSLGSVTISLASWLANIPSQVQAVIDQLFASPTAADVPSIPDCLQDQQSLIGLQQNVFDAITTRDADAAQLRQAALDLDEEAAATTVLFVADAAVVAGTIALIGLSLAGLSEEIAAATVFGVVSTEVATAALSVVSGVEGLLLQTKGEWQALSGSSSGSDMQSKAGAAVEGTNNLYGTASGAAFWFKTTKVGGFLAGTAGTILGSVLSAVSLLLNDPFKDCEAEAVALDNDEATFNNLFSTYETDRDTATQLFDEYTAALADAEANNDPCNPQPPPPDPPDPPTTPNPPVNTPIVNPEDPNAIIGPAGYGTPGFIQASVATLPYTVEFENDGTAAALDVTVTQQLDPNLNWSTFQFGSFGFGSIDVTVPAGLTQYQTTVSYENTDGSALNVQVSLAFNVQTGLLTADFVSLDPLTGQTPEGVFDGFLYPESDSPIGSDGFVEYTIQLNAGLTTGTTINQQASVVFDTNAAIVTSPPALNTIDAAPPTSSVSSLPAITNSTSISVSWNGQDDPGGSGIAGYDVYVSDDGGPFTLWQSATADTSAVYSGLFGHTYAFYSVATDNVDNRQGTPTTGQATTEILPAIATVAQTIAGTEGSTFSGEVATFTDTDLADALSATITWNDGSSTEGTISGPDANGIFTVVGTHTFAEETTGATVSVAISDTAGISATAASTANVSDPAVAANGGLTLSGTAGTAIGAQTVATFTDPGGVEATSDYEATINWGDGNTTVGTISGPDAKGVFTVSGTNTYAEAGTFTPIVTITHDSALSVSVTDTAVVSSSTLPSVTAFVVEKGLAERSFIRYLDVTFNVPVAGLTLDPAHVKLEHFALDGVTFLGDVDLTNKIALVDHVMEIDFGAGGIGGQENLPNLLANWTKLILDDDYYRLIIDPDGTGQHDLEEDFYRLFGDVIGNATGGATTTGTAVGGNVIGQVTTADVNAISAAVGQTGALLDADINGAGSVTANDRLVAAKSVGRMLAAGLKIND